MIRVHYHDINSGLPLKGRLVQRIPDYYEDFESDFEALDFINCNDWRFTDFWLEVVDDSL